MLHEIKKDLWDPMNWFGKLVVLLITIIVAALILLIVFRIAFVDFVDYHELGYTYDSRTGVTTILNRTGYIVNPPIVVSVHTIDLRPMQVCMNANARVLNCKLVKFNVDGFEDFISRHGRGNYDGGNCSTGGSSSGNSSCGNLNEILRSYAFEPNPKYTFFTFVEPSPGSNVNTSGGGS